MSVTVADIIDKLLLLTSQTTVKAFTLCFTYEWLGTWQCTIKLDETGKLTQTNEQIK